jgi:large subunit ribosomal protein L30
MIKITLTSGLVAKKTTQRLVVKALGLKKYGSSVVHADSPTIRGMVNKVHHLTKQQPMMLRQQKNQLRQLQQRNKIRRRLNPMLKDGSCGALR